MIDEDVKVRAEIRRYLKELSIDDIHEFSSSVDFEREYFSSLIQKTEEIVVEKKPVAGMSEDEIKFLNTATFANSVPFDDVAADVEVSLDKLQILKVSTAKIFSKIVTEIVAKNTTIDSFVASPFQDKFKKYLLALSTSDKEVSETLAIENEKKEIWVCHITGKSAGATYTLSFKDKTAEVAKFLGKDGGVEEKKEEAVAKTPVDLIYFKNTAIHDGDIKKWVTKVSTLLTKVELWPTENRTKFVAIRYEDDPAEKSEYSHPFIDDLLCLPFDRLVFLQKTEIVLNLPQKKSPSFLFVQAANDDIEFAKKVDIDRINDLGFAISNPVPIAPGTVGHIYFKLPGQKTWLDVNGKAQHSVAHPEKKGQHLVYFNYFGFNKNLNKEIRAFLARDSAYKNLLNQDPNDFKYNEDNIFFTDEQKEKKTIALLDFDESVVKNTTDYIKGEIHNIDFVSSDSYYGFFKKYLEKKSDNDRAQPAVGDEFFAEIVSFLASSVDLNLQMMLTPPAEEDKILGHQAKHIFSDPQNWLLLFEGDSRNLLTECLFLILTAKRINKNFELVNAEGQKRLVAVEFILEESSNIVRINIRPPEVKFSGRSNQLEKINSLECVIIDYSLLSEDISAFLKGLSVGTQNANIKTPPGGPNVIVMASETQKINFDLLLESKVFALIYKPLEVRRILYLATQAIKTPFSLYNDENIGWKSEHLPAKISRPAKLVELSEFGVTFKTPHPIKVGTLLYLFKSIFQNAPDQNISVRIYNSEEDESEPGTYLNSAIYFGIADSFLKFTRSYIRETYASSKAKEGS